MQRRSLFPGSELRASLADIRAEAGEPPSRGTLGQVEKEHILRVLRGEIGGVISKAARKLGMPWTTLNATLRKLGVSLEDF